MSDRPNMRRGVKAADVPPSISAKGKTVEYNVARRTAGLANKAACRVHEMKL